MLLGVTACGGSSSSGEGEGCESTDEVLLWGGTQWQELAQAVAENASSCAEYYISVPPQDSDKTKLRPSGEFARIRELAGNVHPVAEIRFASEAGWREWAEAKEVSFYDAGVEARRRMAEAGLDVQAGEVWVLNELDADVRENVPGRRDEVLEFLRGLYEGGDDLPDARGAVFDLGGWAGDTDLEAYKASLEEWLQDGEFWGSLDDYVDFFAEEVYPSPQTWGVAGAPLEERAEHLQDFFYHVTTLAEAGPETVKPAREFLHRTYVPLANAAWPHAAIGETHLVSAETMASFVATQVFAMRDYATRERDAVPATVGFAWAPNPLEPSYSDAGRDTVVNRLATAIQSALAPDGEPSAACGAEGQDWCAGDVEGASFDETWKSFSSWD